MLPRNFSGSITNQCISIIVLKSKIHILKVMLYNIMSLTQCRIGKILLTAIYIHNKALVSVWALIQMEFSIARLKMK